MDLWAWLVLAAIAVIVVARAYRRWHPTDDDTIADPGTALERERERARAVEAAVRAGPNHDGPYV